MFTICIQVNNNLYSDKGQSRSDIPKIFEIE